MLRHALSIFAIISAAGLISACGGDDHNDSQDNPSPSTSSSSSSSSGGQGSSSSSSSSSSGGASSSSGGQVAASACAEGASNTDGTVWCATAFGQSVDVNFETNVLPEKKGVNYVWLNGNATPMGVGEAGNLNGTFTLESRGGKIANGHDGLTFYYTRLSTAQNFVLEADITVEQFGPETSATPNAQESAGLMVRDVIGAPRQDPLVIGYEEFPAASNIAANAIWTKNKAKDGELDIRGMYRDGINGPWGNITTVIPSSVYTSIKNVNYSDNTKSNYMPTFKMKLERTDSSYIVSYADANGSNAVSKAINGANANIVQTIDGENMYVGFFAARNARITINHAKLTLSSANTIDAPKFVMTPVASKLNLMSSTKTASTAYTLQARTNNDGSLTIKQDGTVLVSQAAIKGGQFYVLPTTISGSSSTFELSFTPSTGGNAIVKTQTVSKVAITNADSLYVSPNGTAAAAGTQASPLDLSTAMQYVAPGGTIYLLDGTYGQTIFPIEVSGSANKLKKLIAVNKGSAIFSGKNAPLKDNTLTFKASYWLVQGIVVTESPDKYSGLLVTGSYNRFEDVLTHHNGNTGLQISADDVNDNRVTWPAYNEVINSESHSNKDSPLKDADGFAAKLGVGPGNVFRGCISHENIDDGWDLFNKVENGPNEPVLIENSISYSNGSNGFKLGGEGQEVAHILRNSIAFSNGLDGVTDNFNPGPLVIDNTTSFDNKRFNYIFRTNPYGITPMSTFTGNMSVRTDYSGKYDDAVVGNIDPASNYFAKDGKSTNKGGAIITTGNFISITPSLPFQRDAQGDVIRNGFLVRK